MQNGWVANTPDGVAIAIEGNPELQKLFLGRLDDNLPPFAKIISKSVIQQDLAGFHDFQVKPSAIDGTSSAFVLPDLATCPDCIGELLNPLSRFYHYPFISCCHCGPRYSIMTKQPYDRENTVMAPFILCHDCEQEYEAIDNRRFQAQTIACPQCGPRLQFLDGSGKLLEENHDALLAAVRQLKSGKIIALKGIGGYQLLVDAANQEATEQLRQRKHRPKKPFAIMVADLASAQKLCIISQLEQSVLTSSAAPIVLLKRREAAIDTSSICDSAAPDVSLLGIMLPCSPLHHLLLRELGSPLIATSGNRQNEPLCIDENQALGRLSGIADFFLIHDRPILRPLDDSIIRQINGKMTVLRRARGYAPIPITLKTDLPETLAVGGHLKSTIAINKGRQVILSQHLGDLDSEASQLQFQATLEDLQHFFGISPTCIMHDLHSDYVSTQIAQAFGKETQAVQHHYAHILSCMAEHDLEPPVLGIAWDGLGLGTDNKLWGSEFLLISPQGFNRFAHFRPFALPGGIKGIQEPRRAALGLLYEMYPESLFERKDLPFSISELTLLKSALNKQINCPMTTSAGRLFDAVASLLGLCHFNQYEGQAAMMLENIASTASSTQHYQFQLIDDDPIVYDWKNTFEQILDDIKQMISPALIAAKFHNTLSEIILAIAHQAGQKNIVLSGGCFQNALLVENVVVKLETAGFSVYCHERIPPNDGGLALGQLYAAKYLRK
jgi:hydrogenase maturation protein HypF